MSSFRPTMRAIPEPAYRVAEEAPGRDARAKRPPLLSFLLRWSTARRFARVVSLLALDLAGIFLAIFTALLLKNLVRGAGTTAIAFAQTRNFAPLACLVTVLLFARSNMYSDRGERPGFARILATLFQVAVLSLLFALVNGRHFASYYIFYASFFFALLYVGTFRSSYEEVTGALLRAAGYRRRAVLVGSPEHVEAVARALAAGPAPTVEVVGSVLRAPRTAGAV